MITCPNCHQLSREGQRFCGSCGFDLQSAPPVPAPRMAPVGEGQPSPYAYQQQPPAYGGFESRLPTNGGQSPAMRFILIGAAVLIVACCMFACGLVFGFEVIPIVFGSGTTPTPRPRGTPTPTGLLPTLIFFFI